MAVYTKLQSIKRLTNSSLTSIIDVTNLNFKNLSDASLEFLNNINYDEVANSFSVNSGTFQTIEVTNTLTVSESGIPTFTIESSGKATGKDLLVDVSETKRQRFTDFPDYPAVGVPGEIIYTGVAGLDPVFGEDFIGYLQSRGWVSLTNESGAITSTDLVYFDTTDPSDPGAIFSPSTPETIGLLYISSIDASVWIWDGSSYISYSNDAVVLATTYSDFYNLITTSQLDIDKKYLITDFQTIYDQPDFSAIGTPKAVVSTLTGATEPIIVTPVAADEISNVALSTVYPNDSILYDWTFTATEVMGVATKGRITQRTDTSNNTVSYDSRNVVFKRYDDGLGNYTIYWDNGNASNSAIPTFNDITTSYNNYFVNTPPTMVDATNNGFLLNNTVFLTTESYNVRAGINFYNNTFENFLDSSFGNYCYDNIIFGVSNFGNTISDYFWRNTIEGNFQRNTIELGFFNNTIESGFRSNTIDKEFYNNTIGSGFRFNTICLSFRNNTILTDFISNKIGNSFSYNNIGTGFQNNVVGNFFFTNTIGNNFNDNIVSNDFKYNTTGNITQHNIIGLNFYNNTLGVNFESNNIGEYFAENIIGDDFSYNNIAYSFANNTVGNTAQNNTIADEFMNNTIGLEFQLNNIGQYCFSNTISDYFLSNTIGEVFQNNNIAASFEGNYIENDFTNNTTLGNCKYNKIGYDSSINTLGSGFWYNIIGSAFNDNTIGANFKRNNIGFSFQSNVIGVDVYDNEINNYFNNNTVGLSFERNNIGEYFYQNTVGDNVNNLFIQNVYNNQTITSSTNTKTTIAGLTTGFVKNTNGVLESTAFGTSSQYVRGDGTIAAFPATVVNESKAIYIDATYGNNTTGTKYDITKPFLTWAAAIAVAVSGDWIIFNAGSYAGGTMTPVNNVNVFCKPGVTISGGFAVSSSLTWKFLGNAIFTSTDPLRIVSTGQTYDIQFDFDKIEGAISFGIIIADATSPSCKLLVNCNSIVADTALRFGSGANYDIVVNCRQKLSSYSTSALRMGTGYSGSNSCTGSIVVNSPIIENTGTNTFRNVLDIHPGISPNFKGVVNAGIIRSTSSTFIDNGNSNIAAVAYINSGNNIVIRGDLDGGPIPCIVQHSGGATPYYGIVTLVGNMYSDREILQQYQKFANGNGWMDIVIQNGYISSKGIGLSNAMFHRADTWNSIMGGIPGNMKLIDCVAYNQNFNASATAAILRDDNPLLDAYSNPIKKNIFQIYNSLTYIDGGVGGYLADTNKASKELSVHNVRSNYNVNPVYTDTFVPTGIIVDTNLIIPKTRL